MSYIIERKYDDLEPETHRFTSREWHGKYKLECFKMGGFKCYSCDRNICLRTGVVHHTTYKHPGGIYQARPKEIQDKICLLCNSCHERVHSTKSIDGITRMLNFQELCIECKEPFLPHHIQSSGRCETCENSYLSSFPDPNA